MRVRDIAHVLRRGLPLNVLRHRGGGWRRHRSQHQKSSKWGGGEGLVEDKGLHGEETDRKVVGRVSEVVEAAALLETEILAGEEVVGAKVALVGRL